MKAYTGLHPYAFMSYSHKDEDRIKPLIEKLQSVGCNIWYDEGILPADEWAETIAKKLSGASLFFLILSSNSVSSQNVKREIYYAVSNNIPILTFYLENVRLPHGLDLQLGISQSVCTQYDMDTDCTAIMNIFPKDVIGQLEPQILCSTSRFLYVFVQNTGRKNDYSIIQINRENQNRKVLFHHWDSGAFDSRYTCESIHFSPADEFNPNQKDTLYFSVYSDLSPDYGTGAPYLYIQVDFSVIEPNTDRATLQVLGGRKKNQCSASNVENYSGDDPVFWLKNHAES